MEIQITIKENLRTLASFYKVTLDYLLGIGDDQDFTTIAAHHEEEDWTEEELQDIEEFKRFLLSKRKK
jgi:hypothetical protein